MAVTLEMAMRECNNFFERCKYAGEIRIAGGKIVPDVGSPYVYISGSARNDGVHSLVSGAMEDADGEETFDGTLWFLYPPRPFIEIAKQCAEYETKNPTGAYTSESFGHYSYSRATGSNGVVTWQAAFADKLRPYHHMYTEVG